MSKETYQNLAISLISASSWYMHKLKAVLRPYEISPEQYNVLRILKGAKQPPVSASYIKERMIDKGSNITRLVDKMESKGWVSRCLCKSDRRQMDIEISDLGKSIVVKLGVEIDKLIKVLHSLDEKEAGLANQLLIKLKK